MALIGHKKRDPRYDGVGTNGRKSGVIKEPLCSLHCFDEGHLVFINLLFVNGKGKTT